MDRQRESPRRLQGAEGEYRSCQDKKMKAEGHGAVRYREDAQDWPGVRLSRSGGMSSFKVIGVAFSRLLISRPRRQPSVTITIRPPPAPPHPPSAGLRKPKKLSEKFAKKFE
jgi:hypothetical protein